MTQMKRAFLSLFASAAFAGAVFAVPAGPPGGTPILNSHLYQRHSEMNIDTATIRALSVSTVTNRPRFLDGLILNGATYNSTGVDSGIPVIYSVYDFGARCTGVGDDRPAIQATIDAISSGTVHIPQNGICMIGAPGLAVRANMMLVGDGNSVLKATANFPDLYGNSAVVQNYDPSVVGPNPSVANSNVTIRDLFIDGTSTATRCILLQAGTNLNVEHCTTTAPWVSGAHIDVRNFSYGIIDNNYIIGNRMGLGINVLGSAQYIQVTRNRIVNTLDSHISIGTGGATPTKYLIVADNIGDTTGAYGIDLFGDAEELIISNNIISSASLSGIQLNVASSVLYPSNLMISNNLILNGRVALGLNLSTNSVTQILGNQIRDNVGPAITAGAGKELLISQNILDNNGGVGMDLGGSRTIVTHNIIRHKVSNGIQVTNGSDFIISENYIEDGQLSGIAGVGLRNSVISNNVIKNFGQAGTVASQNGIQLTDDVIISSNNVITGNRCYDDQTVKTMFTGISTNQSAGANTIIGNSVFGSSGTPIGVAGTNNIIAYNVGYLTENSGISVAISSGSTIAHGLVGTPAYVSAIPTDSVPTNVYVTAVGATTFTVGFSGGGSHIFYWSARMNQSR